LRVGFRGQYMRVGYNGTRKAVEEKGKERVVRINREGRLWG
jgi:hypothetical protein